jgi:hypothetical protein
MNRKPYEISKSDFKKLYYENTNKVVASKLGLTQQAVINIANKFGFKKGTFKVKVIE